MSENTFLIKYKVGKQQYETNKTECEHFSLNVSLKNDCTVVSIMPKTKLSISYFAYIMPYEFGNTDKVFVNGYQSWTDSLEYPINGKMSEQSRLNEFVIKHTFVKASGIGKSGDIFFYNYPRENGVFYGWSYGYVRRGRHIDLFASTNERSGYTIIRFEAPRKRVVIEKDLEGVEFCEQTELLSLFAIREEYDKAFDIWFEKMGIRSRESMRRNGYTTWYNYYSRIDENVVKRDLASLSAFDAEIHCFQIDDGYQQAIGDWLITDKAKFPNGMKVIADMIHEKGMKAGLWLAPFAVTPNSDLYKNHKDWLICKNGKPYKTGHNWGGFYSLNIYNEGAREYLKHVFDVVLNQWGYDLVKLDFLYGACVLPLNNYPRGKVMCDAMDLIRSWCGDKLVLGCGVPLLPAFGKVDYCRIGADIALSWRHRKHIPREDVSTPHAVCNTIFRRSLNGRAWMNDPDVFLLRKNNIGMDAEQRKLTAVINSTFGSLLFVSDNVADYDADQANTLKQCFAKKDIEILSADLDGEVISAEYLENGEKCSLKFNCYNGRLVK